jgi:hypothetical protein
MASAISPVSPMRPIGLKAQRFVSFQARASASLCSSERRVHADPFFAYSVVSDFVASLTTPFVIAAKSELTPLILGDRELRDVIEARHVHIHHGGVVLGGVFGERLSDADAGLVHQRIDPAKSCDAFENDTLGGYGVADVTGDAQIVLVVRQLDRT